MTADLRRLVKKLWRCSRYRSMYARRSNYRGRYGVICRWHCVIRTWAPWVWGTTKKRYINPLPLPSFSFLLHRTMCNIWLCVMCVRFAAWLCCGAEFYRSWHWRHEPAGVPTCIHRPTCALWTHCGRRFVAVVAVLVQFCYRSCVLLSDVPS